MPHERGHPPPQRSNQGRNVIPTPEGGIIGGLQGVAVGSGDPNQMSDEELRRAIRDEARKGFSPGLGPLVAAAQRRRGQAREAERAAGAEGRIQARRQAEQFTREGQTRTEQSGLRGIAERGRELSDVFLGFETPTPAAFGGIEDQLSRLGGIASGQVEGPAQIAARQALQRGARTGAAAALSRAASNPALAARLASQGITGALAGGAGQLGQVAAQEQLGAAQAALTGGLGLAQQQGQLPLQAEQLRQAGAFGGLRAGIGGFGEAGRLGLGTGQLGLGLQELLERRRQFDIGQANQPGTFERMIGVGAGLLPFLVSPNPATAAAAGGAIQQGIGGSGIGTGAQGVGSFG